MPLKWKIFRIVNYLQTVAALGFALFIFWESNLRFEEDIEVPVILFLCLAVFIANNALNLWWLEKGYPDRYPGRRLSHASSILFALSLVDTLLAILMLYFLLNDLFGPNGDLASAHPDRSAIIALVLISTLCVTGIYVLWNQVVLRRSIRRYQKERFEHFLEPVEE